MSLSKRVTITILCRSPKWDRQIFNRFPFLRDTIYFSNGMVKDKTMMHLQVCTPPTLSKMVIYLNSSTRKLYLATILETSCLCYSYSFNNTSIKVPLIGVGHLRFSSHPSNLIFGEHMKFFWCTKYHLFWSYKHARKFSFIFLFVQISSGVEGTLFTPCQPGFRLRNHKIRGA